MRSAILLLAFVSLLCAEQLSVTQIQQAINEKNAAWQAEENHMTRLSVHERKQRLGARIVPDDVEVSQLLSLPATEELPEKFDWREHNGNWVTPVRDQGACGSCWAFSAVAQVESWWMLYNNDPNMNIDLSEQYCVSCTDGGDCEHGGWVYRVLDFMTTSGIPSESCFPYKAQTNIDCNTVCAGWEAESFTIPGWGWITQGDPNQVENLKRALMYHPVSVSFTVYSDFNAYKSGVYEHVRGDVEGGHAVLLVGWEDENECWIVKNSWGPAWGEDGYFRIKWGDSNMGAYTPFIYDEYLKRGEIFTSTGNLSFNAVSGDVAQQSFTIYNTSNTPLQYYIIERETDEDYDWIDIENSAGFLQPSEQRDITVKVRTRGLNPGTYAAGLGISTNSQSDMVPLSVALDVERPDFDCRVDSALVPISGYAMFREGAFTAKISNNGKNALDGIAVACRLYSEGEVIFSDTTRSGLISSGGSAILDFESFMPRVAGEFKLEVSIIDFEQDYNDFNNSWETWIHISNRFESFEIPSDLWTYAGGWGAGNAMNGHHGFSSVHCNDGIYPYPENMDAILTMTTGLRLDGIDSLFVGFWERHFLNDAGDFCLVEISGDSVNWDLFTTLTGIDVSWNQHFVDFTPYIANGAEMGWIRFHFKSNESGGSLGVIVDDFTVHLSLPEDSTLTQTSVTKQDAAPTEFFLEQNYPNPFNPLTTINFQLAQDSQVRLYVVNSKGQIVSELENGYFSAGHYKSVWQAQDYASGLYFYIIETMTATGEQHRAQKKMVLLK